MWCSPGPQPVAIAADATGRDRRERRHAVADVGAAVEQRRERRRLALGDRLVEHVRLQRVDDREDELLRHYRRILSPAYFSPSRRRPPSEQHDEARDREERERRHEDRDRREEERGAVRVGGEERRLVRLEPARAPARRARRPRASRAPRRAGRAASPIHASSPPSASAPREQQRAQHDRRSAPASTRRDRAACAASPWRRAAPLALDEGRRRRRRPRTPPRKRCDSRKLKSVPSKSIADVAARERAGEERRQVRPDRRSPTRGPRPCRCRGRGSWGGVGGSVPCRAVRLTPRLAAAASRSWHELLSRHRALRRPVRLADEGHEVLRDARPDGGHRAARGDLARRRPARHEHVPAATRSPRSRSGSRPSRAPRRSSTGPPRASRRRRSASPR